MSETFSPADIMTAVSTENLMADLTRVAAEDRAPGSDGEARVFDYIEEQLRRLPAEVTRLTMEGFVSVPVSASLHVTSRDSAVSVPCVAHSASASTPPGGYRSMLVAAGTGTAQDYAGDRVRGNIALITGQPTVTGLRRADDAGCPAQIYIDGTPVVRHHLSSLAGNPTDETMKTLPKSVAVSVTDADGRRLRQILDSGPVEATITAAVDTGWRPLPLITADLRPDDGEPTYAFFASHVDSWHQGAVDNGAGTAALLEIARVLARYRQRLRRGVRLIFWSGHEHGLYAGSSWYVDKYWQDLYQHAIVALGIDSPGARNPTHLARSKVMDEVAHVAADAAALVTGWHVPAPSRPQHGEQPLWRIGVPSLSPDRLTPDDRSWMHTVDDRIDLVDPKVLVADTQIHLVTLWSVVAADRLPFRYEALARAIAEGLEALDGAIDLSGAIALARELESLAACLPRLPAPRANEAYRLLGRCLIPTLYTRSGSFELDAAPVREPDSSEPRGFLVGLQDAARLGEMETGTLRFHGTKVRLLRQRNRLEFALRGAISLCEQAIAASSKGDAIT